jgi:hypothetical protein
MLDLVLLDLTFRFCLIGDVSIGLESGWQVFSLWLDRRFREHIRFNRWQTVTLIGGACDAHTLNSFFAELGNFVHSF